MKVLSICCGRGNGNKETMMRSQMPSKGAVLLEGHVLDRMKELEFLGAETP